MTEVEQTKWLCDIALKRLEALHKDFDTLNGRAASIVGFAGLFNSLLLPSWQKVHVAWRLPIGVVWLSLVSLMLWFALGAYQITEVRSLPARRDSIDRLNDMDEESARRQFISNTIDASEAMSLTNRLKAYRLRVSTACFGLQIILSIIVIIVSGIYF